jgi:DNA-binding transcriptional regulator YhcF (GntR family)
MSGVALIWASNVKGLKPSAKLVLCQLADFHNKETGQCNPSAQRLADECEMSRATVFRHLTELEEKGLITRQAKGDGKGGRASNQYKLHLDVVLGPSAKHKERSQNETTPLVSNCDKGSLTGETGVVSNCDTNLNKEPGIEPCVSGDADPHTIFQNFWEVHPRPKDRSVSERRFFAAVEGGVDAKDILFSAQSYAQEQSGNRKQFICGSDAWLSDERWTDFERPKPESAEDCAALIQKMKRSPVASVREAAARLAASQQTTAAE